MILRDYQQAAVDSIYGYFAQSHGNPLVVVPTGGGKSLVQAAFIKSVIGQWPDQRIMLLTHVKELLLQNGKELVALWPEAEPLIGYYSAGLCSRRTDRQITIAGIQSVYKRAAEFGRQHLVMIDEAHLVSPKGHTMYQQFIGELRAINPDLKVIGLTATPYRLDSGMLAGNGASVFTDICYNTDLRHLVDSGYLAPLTTKLSKARTDLSKVRVRGGEYVPGELERTMNSDDVVDRALDEAVALCADRKKWLVFCSGVEHAWNVHAKLIDRGVSAACITGETPDDARDAIIDAFKRGELRALTNVNVLTTGFNVPDIDAMVVLRPTKSPGLHVQMLGRGMRTAPGKTDCLVLDFSDNILTHGPIADIKVKPVAGGEPRIECAPQRICPGCGELCAIAARECLTCGHVFAVDNTPKHGDLAAIGADVLFAAAPEREREELVESWSFRRHTKPGKPDSLRVTYEIDWLTSYSEWICFDHGGYAAQMAGLWWLNHGGKQPAPRTTTAALLRASELKMPDAIRVKRAGKYWRILGTKISNKKCA